MSNASKRTPRALTRPVFVHPEVQHYLGAGRWERLAGRATLVMKALAVQGTWHFKGVTGVNRGWRRTGLGGNGGFHFYLWWTVQGSGPGKNLPLEPGAVVVRAVRHHDATDERTPLPIGRLDEYERVGEAHFDLGVESDPWTPAQRAFLASASRVRVLRGLPGSGKTTCLWETVERLGRGKVLYLTWSRALADTARRYFDVHAAKDADIEVQSFGEFVRSLLQEDLEPVPFREGVARFVRLVSQRVRNHALRNAIERDPELYFGLMRGWIKGRHLWQGRVPPPVDFERHVLEGDRGNASAPANESSEQAEPVDAIDPIRAWDDAIQDALHRTRQVFEGLKLKDQDEKRLFPELWGAVQLKRRRTEGASVLSRRSWDLIVVDEVQDLTPAEIDIILQVSKAKPKGEPPTELIFAGDEGQSVRHTYFEWREVNNLLATSLEVASEVQLDENQRNPAAIGRALQEAQKLYLKLERGLRPGGQRVEVGEVAGEATVCLTEISSEEEGARLLKELAEQTDTAFIHLDEDAPEWARGDELVRDRLRTPAEAKGLEFGAVCVLGAGRALSELTDTLARRDPLKYRLGVNRLRVAMSRATQTLAFVEVTGASTREVLGLAAGERLSPESLHDRLVDSEVPPDERLARLVETARHDMEERPGPAWRSLLRVRALGAQEGYREAWIELGLETEVNALCARIALGQALHPADKAIRGEELEKVGAEALEATGGERLVALRDALVSWRRAKDAHTRDEAGVRVVMAIDRLEGHPSWLASELGRVRVSFDELVTRLAQDVSSTGLFAGRVEFWFECFGFDGVDVLAKGLEARRRAFDTSLNEGHIEIAIALMGQLEALGLDDSERKVALWRATGRYRDAAVWLEARGELQKAFDAWFEAGEVAEALRVGTWVEGEQRMRLAGLSDALKLLDGGLDAREMRLIALRCLAEGEAVSRAEKEIRARAKALEVGFGDLEVAQRRLREEERALAKVKAAVLKNAEAEAAERMKAFSEREEDLLRRENDLEEFEKLMLEEQKASRRELELGRLQLEKERGLLELERVDAMAATEAALRATSELREAEVAYAPKVADLEAKAEELAKKARELAAASRELAERENRLTMQAGAVQRERANLEALKQSAVSAKIAAETAELRLEQRMGGLDGRERKLKEREKAIEMRERDVKQRLVWLEAGEERLRAAKQAETKGESTR